MTCWATRSAVVAAGLTATRSGLSRYSSASPAMLLGIVAEKNRLCRSARYQLGNTTQRMNEAEVEHLVGLVEHQRLDMREAQRPAIDQIEQAARCGDEDIDAALELADLAVDRHATEHDLGGDTQVATIDADIVGDLAGQFAGRRQDQSPATARLARFLVTREAIENRQREGGGLAGARLGDAEQVTAFENQRNRLGLDRSRSFIAFAGERLEDGLGETEIGKCGQDCTFCACGEPHRRVDACGLVGRRPA